jgi:hypothetical protein
MDEGWQAATRDSTGRQQANSTKFPSGLSSLASYVHSLGLKIGIYRLDHHCAADLLCTANPAVVTRESTTAGSILVAMASKSSMLRLMLGGAWTT